MYLADHDVVAEMTPTDRAAVIRFTFPEGESFVVVDAFDHGSEVSISGRRVTGAPRATAAVCRTISPTISWWSSTATPTMWRPADGKELHPDSLAYAGEHAGAVIGFRTKRGEQVTAAWRRRSSRRNRRCVNLGEVAGARLRLGLRRGRQRWNDVLGRIEIRRKATRTIGGLSIRVSTARRCFRASSMNWTPQGRPCHYSPYNGEVLPGYMYTDTGFWDTFRCLFPLLNLLYPSVNREIQEGWSTPTAKAGSIPNGPRRATATAWWATTRLRFWPTRGSKGRSRLRYGDALGGCRGRGQCGASVGALDGPLGFDYYNRLGYVPCDVGIRENVARTLGMPMTTGASTVLDSALGRPAGEVELYARRARNYRNVFLPSASLMCGRQRRRIVRSTFLSPLKWGGAFTGRQLVALHMVGVSRP